MYGSVFDTITTRTFKDIIISIPSVQEINKFEKSVKPLFQKMKKNKDQTYTLERIRETLLPKLMSGEVRM